MFNSWHFGLPRILIIKRQFGTHFWPIVIMLEANPIPSNIQCSANFIQQTFCKMMFKPHFAYFTDLGLERPKMPAKICSQSLMWTFIVGITNSRYMKQFNPIPCGRFYFRFHAGGIRSEPPWVLLGQGFEMTLESLDIIRICKMEYFCAILVMNKSCLVDLIYTF